METVRPGIESGSSKRSSTIPQPGNVRRTNAYPPGTPMSRQARTFVSASWMPKVICGR